MAAVAASLASLVSNCAQHEQTRQPRYSFTAAESTWAVRLVLDSLHAHPPEVIDSAGRAAPSPQPRWSVERFTRDSSGFVVTIGAKGGLLDGLLILHVSTSGQMDRIFPHGI